MEFTLKLPLLNFNNINNGNFNVNSIVSLILSTVTKNQFLELFSSPSEMQDFFNEIFQRQ